VRVLLIEDHVLYRRGLARAIAERRGELELVGDAADGYAGLALVADRRPDVVLLDLRLPGIDGIEILRRLRRQDPEGRTRVLMLSAFVDPDFVARAVAAGASGYLDKHEPHEAICDAILRAARGERAFSASTAWGLEAGG
jgi:DNA-binding NarL/FixJ family response regulator